MAHTIKQIDDFVGRMVEAIADKIRSGVAPVDVPTTIGQVTELLIERVYGEPKTEQPYRCCCQGTI